MACTFLLLWKTSIVCAVFWAYPLHKSHPYKHNSSLTRCCLFTSTAKAQIMQWSPCYIKHSLSLRAQFLCSYYLCRVISGQLLVLMHCHFPLLQPKKPHTHTQKDEARYKTPSYSLINRPFVWEGSLLDVTKMGQDSWFFLHRWVLESYWVSF